MSFKDEKFQFKVMYLTNLTLELVSNNQNFKSSSYKYYRWRRLYKKILKVHKDYQNTNIQSLIIVNEVYVPKLIEIRVAREKINILKNSIKNYKAFSFIYPNDTRLKRLRIFNDIINLESKSLDLIEDILLQIEENDKERMDTM